MAKKSMVARDKKRLKMIAKYAAKRAKLKELGDLIGLQKLPRNSSPPGTRTATAFPAVHVATCASSA